MPLGIIKNVTTNSLGEVVSVAVMKGGTREVVNRHVSSIIPVLESVLQNDTPNHTNTALHTDRSTGAEKRPRRRAAVKASRECQRLAASNLV